MYFLLWENTIKTRWQLGVWYLRRPLKGGMVWYFSKSSVGNIPKISANTFPRCVVCVDLRLYSRIAVGYHCEEYPEVAKMILLLIPLYLILTLKFYKCEDSQHTVRIIPCIFAALKLSQPSPTHPSTTHHFREIDRRLMTSQVPALNTTAFPPRILSNITTDSTENNTLDTTTRNPLGLYKYRESRILDTPVTEENQPDASNFTSWQLPFLPERRNEEEAGKMDAMEKRLEGHPEGWTPFTIPHDLLPKFLFSTLMMEPLTSTTGYHSTVTKPSMSTSKYLDQTDKLSTIFEEESTGGWPVFNLRQHNHQQFFWAFLIGVFW